MSNFTLFAKLTDKNGEKKLYEEQPVDPILIQFPFQHIIHQKSKRFN